MTWPRHIPSLQGGAADAHAAAAGEAEEEGYIMASLPAPQRRTGAVSISEAMSQSKARDAMNQRKTW